MSGYPIPSDIAHQQHKILKFREYYRSSPESISSVESSGSESPFPSPTMTRIYNPIPLDPDKISPHESLQQIEQLKQENEFLYATLEKLRLKYLELLQL